MKIKAVFTCIGIVLSLQSIGQYNIPLATLPMLYNGGFAGEAEKARFVAGGGFGFSNFNGRSLTNTYFGSYDQFFPRIRSGIGITYGGYNYGYYMSNVVGEFRHRENLLMLSFSPKLSFKGKRTLAPFIDLALNYTKAKTALYIPDSRRGFLQASGRVGVLYNSRKFYAGITYYAFTTGNSVDVYPIQSVKGHPFILQTGYTFQKLPESKFSFTPHVAFIIMREDYTYINIDLNFMFRYKKFIWSLNNTGLGLGYQNSNFRIMLSQNHIFFSTWVQQNSLSIRYVLK